MYRRTDEMRLRDGARAIQTLSQPEPTTIAELERQLDIVANGARALQSLDDLGSPEANQAAWDDMTRLLKRMGELEERIASLQTKH